MFRHQVGVGFPQEFREYYTIRNLSASVCADSSLFDNWKRSPRSDREVGIGILSLCIYWLEVHELSIMYGPTVHDVFIIIIFYGLAIHLSFIDTGAEGNHADH